MNQESTYNSAILTDLQSRLLADQDGSSRRALGAELESWEEELRRALQAGLPRDEYERAQRLHGGIQAARQILEECCRTEGGL